MKHIKKKNIRKSKQQLLLGIFILLVLTLSFASYSLFFNNTFLVFKYSKNIETPRVDVASCYSNKDIQIRLSTENKKCKIYYTLDGTEPNQKSIVYDGKEILINNQIKKDTFLYSIPTSPRWKSPLGDIFCFKVLRAICVDENGNKGGELKASYIIDKGENHHYSIPVFSFIFNPDDLFGYRNGIYVMGKTYEDKDNYVKRKIKFDIPWWQYPANYLKKGKNSDRSIFVEYFCLDEKQSNSFNSTMRIHGFNTRGFAQKSFRVPITTKDSSCIPMFNSNRGVLNYIFRNGGNDWTKTLLRDAFIHEVMKGSSLSVQAYQPVVCFFNGEYWGIHTLRERFDEYYIQNKYDISKDSISILELNGEVMVGQKSESKAFNSLMNYILNNDMSKDDNYKVIENQMDIQNLIDYTIVNIFFVNNDWPNNNLKYWRYSYPSADKSYRDNKWRFVLSDMDWAMGFNISKAYEFDMFEFIKNKKQFGLIFNQLLQNKEFKKQFLKSFERELNTRLSPERLQHIFRLLITDITEIMPEHISRWREMGDYDNWYRNTNILFDFNQKRSKTIASQLKNL